MAAQEKEGELIVNENDVYCMRVRECLLDDTTCDGHYHFAGRGLDQNGLPNNRLDICWHDSWYDEDNNRTEEPSWKITLKRSMYWGREEKARNPEDWRSISETRWTLFVGSKEEVVEEAVRRYRLVIGTDLNVIYIDEP